MDILKAFSLLDTEYQINIQGKKKFGLQLRSLVYDFYKTNLFPK